MDNTYNIDFIARCIAGHNKSDIKSIITELENVQKQIGGVSLVEITQEDFDALTDKDPSTIYLVSNGDKITLYIGGTEVNEIEGIKVNNTTINPDSNKVVNITVPTTAADISALPDTTKYAAALSLTINSLTYVMTGQLKDQNGDNLGTAQTIDLPLESVVVDGSYNSQTKKVVLTLQNGNTIEFSVADLVLGLQTELSASNKLNPAYIDYNSTHRAVSDTEKSTWNGKQSALSTAQLAAVNSGIDSTKVAQIETNKNNILLNKTDIYNNFAIGKNKLTYTLTTLQSLNTDGTWNNNEWTKNGVTFTLNPDNTITATGTLPASTNVIMTLQNYTGVTGDILTAEQYGADHYIYLRGGSTAANNVIYKAFTDSDIGVSRQVAIAIIGDASESKTVHYLYKPMVCNESAYLASPTYFPYAMSNVELTAAVQALQAQLANQ